MAANFVERKTGLDLDGDGDVGLDDSQAAAPATEGAAAMKGAKSEFALVNAGGGKEVVGVVPI